MVSEIFDSTQWRPVEGLDFQDITYHRALEQGTVRIGFNRPEWTIGDLAAMAAGGQTLVVLAGGIARPYPAAHRPLFDAVVQGGGAVVSPHEPGSSRSQTRLAVPVIAYI